jgi:probable addiction module antidote protein
MAEALTTYDPAEDLADDEAIAVFMADAFETGDSRCIASALGVVARAKGMKQIAEETNAALGVWTMIQTPTELHDQVRQPPTD